MRAPHAASLAVACGVPIPPEPSVGARGCFSPALTRRTRRLSLDLSVSDAGGSLDLAQREPRDSGNAAAAGEAPPQLTVEAPSPRAAMLAAQDKQRGRTGSPLPWLAPLAKKLRRNTSFGRLIGKS